MNKSLQEVLQKANEDAARVDIVDIKNGNYTSKLLVLSPGGNLTTMFFDEKGKFLSAVIQDKKGRSVACFEQEKDGLRVNRGEGWEKCNDEENIHVGLGGYDAYANRNQVWVTAPFDGKTVHNSRKKGFCFEFNRNVYVNYLGRSDSLRIIVEPYYTLNHQYIVPPVQKDFSKAFDKESFIARMKSIRNRDDNR